MPDASAVPASTLRREVPEAPDFAALFPRCTEGSTEGSTESSTGGSAAEWVERSEEDLRASNHMTALDAARMWRELHLCYHDALMDIALFGETPYDPDAGIDSSYLRKSHWVVFWTLPSVTWSASVTWRNRFAQCFLHLADDLAAGQQPRPRTFAEALALALVNACVFGRYSRYHDEEDPYADSAWDDHDGIAPTVRFDLHSGLTYTSRSPLNPERDTPSPPSAATTAAPTSVPDDEVDDEVLPTAPESLDDWHLPADRPSRVEPFVWRQRYDDEGYLDWASLFPARACGQWEECPRCGHIQMTPRTALALRFASEILYDYAREDVGRFGDDAVDGRFMVFSRYPHVTWYQDGRWRARAAEAYHDLGDDLIEGKWPLPQTHAEEMALHILLEEVDYITEVFADALEELPAHPLDYDTEALRDGLFQDEDILMLFDMPHLASPDDPVNASMHMGDMRPNSWFKPFGQFQPRERPEPDTSNVTPIRGS